MAEHSGFQIAQFFKVAQSFVVKDRKELQDNDDQIYPAIKQKKARETLCQQ